MLVVGIKCKLNFYRPEPNVCLCSCLRPIVDVKRLFLRFRTMNPLYYHWTTHDPRALSDKDTKRGADPY